MSILLAGCFSYRKAASDRLKLICENFTTNCYFWAASSFKHRGELHEQSLIIVVIWCLLCLIFCILDL
uniref:Uncharacterized protein n=1 Tax=Salix viminalis TaxID=40686 RepID=A0A6N2MB23_SALVM